VLNQEIPRGVPVRPMGRISVIARLVVHDGLELRPGVAIRWTATHVMVCVEHPHRPADLGRVPVAVRSGCHPGSGVTG
jgi:hypothetical protein